jgi:hypothetical protein
MPPAATMASSYALALACTSPSPHGTWVLAIIDVDMVEQLIVHEITIAANVVGVSPTYFVQLYVRALEKSIRPLLLV